MITIIDENNLVTEDGVELVSNPGKFTRSSICEQCYLFSKEEDCCQHPGVPCDAVRRHDGREVIFVEKNPC